VYYTIEYIAQWLLEVSASDDDNADMESEGSEKLYIMPQLRNLNSNFFSVLICF